MELCKKVYPVMPDSLKFKYLMGDIKEPLKIHVLYKIRKQRMHFYLLQEKLDIY